MTRFFTILFLLFPHVLLAADKESQDDLLWGYADFLHALEEENYEAAERYIDPQTTIGFGGDKGVSGFKRLIDNKACVDDLVLALKQGCKVTQEEGETGCVSPPQFTDEETLYLGARLKFVHTENDEVKIQYLVCGGD